MVRKNIRKTTTVAVGLLSALALSMGFIMIEQPEEASASHVGGATHVDIIGNFGMDSQIPWPMYCPCPQPWAVGQTGTVGSGREKLESVTFWAEGYDDIDTKMVSPSGTTYLGITPAPKMYEIIVTSNPQSGTWTYYARAYAISTLDESAGTGIRWYNTAYETTPLP